MERNKMPGTACRLGRRIGDITAGKGQGSMSISNAWDKGPQALKEAREWPEAGI